MILRLNLLLLGFLVVGFPGYLFAPQTVESGRYMHPYIDPYTHQYTHQFMHPHWRQDPPDAPDAPNTPDAPDAPNAPNAPDAPDAPDDPVPAPARPPGSMRPPAAMMMTTPKPMMIMMMTTKPTRRPIMFLTTIKIPPLRTALNNTAQTLGAGIQPLFKGFIELNKNYTQLALNTMTDMPINFFFDSMSMMVQNFFGVFTQVLTSGVTAMSQLAG